MLGRVLKEKFVTLRVQRIDNVPEHQELHASRLAPVDDVRALHNLCRGGERSGDLCARVLSAPFCLKQEYEEGLRGKRPPRQSRPS